MDELDWKSHNLSERLQQGKSVVMMTGVGYANVSESAIRSDADPPEL